MLTFLSFLALKLLYRCNMHKTTTQSHYSDTRSLNPASSLRPLTTEFQVPVSMILVFNGLEGNISCILKSL